MRSSFNGIGYIVLTDGATETPAETTIEAV